MFRKRRNTLIVAAVLALAVGLLLAFLDRVSVAPAKAASLPRSKQVDSEQPASGHALAGDYYCGDGLGYNVTLKLSSNGTYSAELTGCLGKYGDAKGRWSLSGTNVVLHPLEEAGLMKGHLTSFDVHRSGTGWVFVRADSDSRRHYSELGGRAMCFQRSEGQIDAAAWISIEP